MEDHIEDVIDFHSNSADYIGDKANHWEQFYDAIERFETEGQSDRDSMRMRLDCQE